MRRNDPIISEALLLAVVLCFCVYGFTAVKAYERIPDWLGMFICVLPITLPITHVMWRQKRREFEQFRAVQWDMSENYAQYTYVLQDSQFHLQHVHFFFRGTGTQWCAGDVILPIGQYQVEIEFPAGGEVDLALHPDPDVDEYVQLFSASETRSHTLNVTKPLTGCLRVRTSSHKVAWKCMIKTIDTEYMTSIDRDLSDQVVFYRCHGSGDQTSASMHLPPSTYELRWNTPYSQIDVEIVDVTGNQPNNLIIHRARNRSRALPHASKRFNILQGGSYRFKVSVWPRSRDDKWQITVFRSRNY